MHERDARAGRRRRTARNQLARLGLAALFLAGCASHNLRVPRPVVGETLHQARTRAIGWGVSEDYAIADKCADTNRIAEVQVRTSFWQSLVTVLTLGLWQPADIRYRCGKQDTGIGEIPR